MARTFDYRRLDRLEQKLKGLELHSKELKKKTGRTFKREVTSAIKKLKSFQKKEDKLQSALRILLSERDTFDKDELKALETELNRAIRYTFPKDDPRKKDFE